MEIKYPFQHPQDLDNQYLITYLIYHEDILEKVYISKLPIKSFIHDTARPAGLVVRHPFPVREIAGSIPASVAYLNKYLLFCFSDRRYDFLFCFWFLWEEAFAFFVVVVWIYAG